MNIAKSIITEGCVFDINKIVFTQEVFKESQIKSCTKSFEKGFESTLKFVEREGQIIIVDHFTKKIN